MNIVIKSLIFLILLSISALAFSGDNPLYGKWVKESDRGKMVITFGESSMSMSNSLNPEANSQVSKIQYKKLDKSWGIEMLSSTGKVEGVMMAIFTNKDQIKFGAPGSSFLVLNRVQ